MSWLSRGQGKDVDETLKDLELNTPVMTAVGVKDQIEAASQAAELCMKSGVLGDGPYRVVISGHSKQGNMDIQGNSLSIAIHSTS